MNILKKLNVLLVIALTTVCVGHVYFHTGFPYTHDGENHLARFANYAIAVREGQLPPRFAPNLLNHYGYPVFDFNYPLANILSLPFSALKINYEFTFKIIALVAICLGATGSLFWLRALGFRFSTQLLGVLVFAANLYLANTVIFRGNIGEILAICLLPWMFWVIENARRKEPRLLFNIALVAAFALSHNITFIFSLPILISYTLLRCKKYLRRLLIIVLSAAGLTLWFWLPALAEKSVTVLDQSGVNLEFLNHFPTFAQLLFSPLQFGFSYSGPIDSLSFALGLFQVVCLILGIGFVLLNIKKWQQQKVLIWAVFVSVALLVCQLQIMRPLWQVILPIAKYLQFPWRLSIYWGVVIIPVFGFVWESLPRFGKKLLALLLIWQILTIVRVPAVDYFHRQVQDYNFFTQSTSTANENRSSSFTFTDIAHWQPSAQIIEGAGQIKVVSWRGSSRKYDLSLQTDSLIVEPTMNFLGWQTIVNGQKIIYINSEQIGGRIAYRLPAGDYLVQSEFTQWTWPRILGNSISIITFVGLGLWPIGIYIRGHRA